MPMAWFGIACRWGAQICAEGASLVESAFCVGWKKCIPYDLHSVSVVRLSLPVYLALAGEGFLVLNCRKGSYDREVKEDEAGAEIEQRGEAGLAPLQARKYRISYRKSVRYAVLLFRLAMHHSGSSTLRRRSAFHCQCVLRCLARNLLLVSLGRSE